MAAIDVGFAIYTRYVSDSGGLDGTPIAYAAHLGGGVAGFLIGICVLKNVKVEVRTEISLKCTYFFLIRMPETVV